jgi:hypothetical protein
MSTELPIRIVSCAPDGMWAGLSAGTAPGLDGGPRREEGRLLSLGGPPFSGVLARGRGVPQSFDCAGTRWCHFDFDHAVDEHAARDHDPVVLDYPQEGGSGAQLGDHLSGDPGGAATRSRAGARNAQDTVIGARARP